MQAGGTHEVNFAALNLRAESHQVVSRVQRNSELCLMSCIFGENRDIFFPKLSEALHLISFAVVIAGRSKNDLEESIERHNLERHTSLPLRLESWDSLLNKLSGERAT
jgi:hypothetical protein